MAFGDLRVLGGFKALGFLGSGVLIGSADTAAEVNFEARPAGSGFRTCGRHPHVIRAFGWLANKRLFGRLIHQLHQTVLSCDAPLITHIEKPRVLSQRTRQAWPKSARKDCPTRPLSAQQGLPMAIKVVFSLTGSCFPY